MKSSLVLVAVLVLNAFVVMLKTNTSNSSKTNGQTHFNEHINMDTMIISRYTLLDQSANYMWKCGQYLAFYNNMASAYSVQIFSKEYMISKNNIIRIVQSTFIANANSTRIVCTKTSSMNKFQSTSSILTTHKLKSKSTFSVLRNNKAEVMINTPLSNTASNSQKRVWIGYFVCDQLFRVQRRYKQECNQPHYLEDLFLTFRCQSRSHNSNLSKVQLQVQTILSKFACCFVRCCN
ncbi:hypothetical protein RFI_04844, partial [Reticulomyxa filosa]